MARASEVSSSWGSSGLWEVCSGNAMAFLRLCSTLDTLTFLTLSNLPPSLNLPLLQTPSPHTVVPLTHSGIWVNKPGPPHSTSGSVPLLSSHCGALAITTEVSPHSGIRVVRPGPSFLAGELPASWLFLAVALDLNICVSASQPLAGEVFMMFAIYIIC